MVIAPTVSPVFVIAVDAALSVRPTTFGTATCAGPDETTNATAAPAATGAPAAGFWLMIDPDGTVALGDVVTTPTTRPAATMASEAAGCVSPTTFGTVGGGVAPRISMAAAFQRSLVGVGSLSVTAVPAAATGSANV